MSGRTLPLYCTLILITMHSHQSYPNITTVIHSYEYSTTIDNISTIETYMNRGLGKIVKCTLVYCIISLIVMQGYFKKKTQNAPRPEHPPVVGGKKQTQGTREAWDTTQFLEFITLHL